LQKEKQLAYFVPNSLINMGRPRKHNIDGILDQGVDLLRRQGYHYTGLEDILTVCGLPKGSFYGSFHSKEDFGIRVLQRYVAMTTALMRKHTTDAKEASAFQRLHNFYAEIIEYFVAEGCVYGCLLNNLTLELAGYNDAFRDAIEAGHASFINTLAPCVKQAQEKGEMKTFLPAQDMAFYIHTNFDGAIVKMKGARDRYPLDLFLDTTFTLIAA
jgi:TetR/AcrR family transcriptional repressor of nem operon